MGLIKAAGELLRELLDTHGRIAAAATIVIALGGGALVAATSRAFLNIHGLLLWAVALLAFGALMMLGAIYVGKNPVLSNPQSVTPAAAEVQALAAAPGVTAQLPNFNFDNYFRLAYISNLTEQTERDIKILVAQQHPKDREDTLAKFIGIGFWGYMHEATWAYIFRSQVLALTELNRRLGLMPVPDAQPFYEEAKAGNAGFYANYSFDQWLNFMQAYQLLIRHPSEMLEITLRGRDFLKFLTHWGWTADNRKS